MIWLSIYRLVHHMIIIIIIPSLIIPDGVVEPPTITFWQLLIIYLGHEKHFVAQQKTGLSIPGCYLSTSSASFFIFIFLLAPCLAGWFLPFLISSHVIPHHFFFSTNINRLSYHPKAAVILFLTFLLVMWSLYKMFKILR